MICHNEKCGRQVERPLELYDGSWACPYCKHEMMSAFSEFAVTAENEELFILSERSYYRWLTNVKLLRESAAQKLIDKAVELCKESARLGNPMAVARLGFYYDKDYVEVNRSEAVRCRIAYAYYSAVCYSHAELKVEDGVRHRYDWKEIRIDAAKRMLEMLAFVPEEIASLDKFNFEFNRTRVREELGIDVHVTRTEGAKSGREEQAYSVLYSCFAKQKAPLFGIFRLTGDELKRMFKIAVGNRFDVYRMAERGVFLAVAECDARGSIKDEGGVFTALRNRRRIDEVLEGLSDDSLYCAYFFNENGGHRFFGKYGLSVVKKTLEENRFALVKRLVSDGGRLDYTFCDDDVYLYKTKLRSTGDAVKKLVAAVCEGERI